MSRQFTFAFTVLLAVPALVVVLPFIWLLAGVIAAISRLAAQMRRVCGDSVPAGV